MLSTTTKHALRALNYFATLDQATYVQVEEASKAVNIPAPYLAKIIKILAQKGLLDTKRGRLGGARLTSSTRKITFFDVCVALEDPVIVNKCVLSKERCNQKRPCPHHYEWSNLRDRLLTFLKNIEITHRN